MRWEDIEPVPMERVSQFARQITHDIRNGLNAIDLQAAYLSEIVEDEEAREETQTLRTMVREVTRMLQTLSRKFQEPSVEVIDCAADILLESLQGRMDGLFPRQKNKINWRNDADSAVVRADVESLTEVLGELLRNASQFAPGEPLVEVTARSQNGRFLLEVVESEVTPPEAEPACWGAEPLVSTQRGSFGLGLFKARASLAAQSGSLRHRYDAESRRIVSQISLPLAPA